MMQKDYGFKKAQKDEFNIWSKSPEKESDQRFPVQKVLSREAEEQMRNYLEYTDPGKSYFYLR